MNGTVPQSGFALRKSAGCLVALLYLASAAVQARGADWHVTNREKTLTFRVILEASTLSYEVIHRGEEADTVVVERSPLGLVRGDSAFTNGLVFVGTAKPKKFDESYSMLTGKKSRLRNRGLEQILEFANAHGAPLHLVVRAYADGVAFAYRFPEASGRDITLLDETTGFTLPEGRAWLLPYDPVGLWAPAYEADWQSGIAVGTRAPANKRGWCFPALFEVRERWVLLTEANLDGTSFATHLDDPSEEGTYRIRLPEPEETYGVAPVEATATLPWQSPWRVIMAGSSPGTILESSLVDHLSDPSEIDDTSWIKPGRVSWSWWSDTGSPGDYDRLKRYVDLAAQLGWEYSLVDCGWPHMKNGDVWQLNEYARSRGVGLVLWYNSGGQHSQVLDAGPRDLMHDPHQRRAEMAKLQQAGVKGIKVDFMQSDKQYVLQMYRDILHDAARHHLLVDFHGSTIPRGWARTFPNLMSMEAIAGAEQYWSTNFAEDAHTFHTIYPFTRNVVGSMDYTPVIFGNAPDRVPHRTTNPHELATAIAFESGLQHFADSASNYLAAPAFVQDFLKRVPATWDDTRYLGGTPGELLLLARRKGEDWYVAGLNGRAEPQKVEVPLSFLGRGRHQVECILDASDPRDFDRQTHVVTRTGTLPMEMAARGGFAMRLTKR